MRIAPETIVFFYACLVGAGLGVVYDLFRLLRLVTGGNAVAIFAEDVMFAMAASGVTFWVCLTSCSGWLRGFVLIGEGLGFLLYHFTLGEVVIRVFRLLLRILKWIFRTLWKFLLYPPMHCVFVVLHSFFNNILMFLQKCRKVCFSHKFSLQLPRKILYNKHNKQAKVGKGGGNPI